LALEQGHTIGSAATIAIAVLTGAITTDITAIINKQYISPAKPAGLICLTGLYNISPCHIFTFQLTFIF
jgi:hypothetical protein